jgi:DNA-3-methyladenine glycosylase I
VRHRGKIEASINNARRLLELLDTEGSLLAYVRRFEPAPADRPAEITYAWAMQRAHTEASRALAKDLKRRGWAFVGPTTVYAFMQAMGLVNDHLTGCDARARVEEARSKRPPLEVRPPSTIPT